MSAEASIERAFRAAYSQVFRSGATTVERRRAVMDGYTQHRTDGLVLGKEDLLGELERRDALSREGHSVKHQLEAFRLCSNSILSSRLTLIESRDAELSVAREVVNTRLTGGRIAEEWVHGPTVLLGEAPLGTTVRRSTAGTARCLWWTRGAVPDAAGELTFSDGELRFAAGGSQPAEFIRLEPASLALELTQAPEYALQPGEVTLSVVGGRPALFPAPDDAPGFRGIFALEEVSARHFLHAVETYFANLGLPAPTRASLGVGQADSKDLSAPTLLTRIGPHDPGTLARIFDQLLAGDLDALRANAAADVVLSGPDGPVASGEQALRHLAAYLWAAPAGALDAIFVTPRPADDAMVIRVHRAGPEPVDTRTTLWGVTLSRGLIGQLHGPIPGDAEVLGGPSGLLAAGDHRGSQEQRRIESRGAGRAPASPLVRASQSAGGVDSRLAGETPKATRQPLEGLLHPPDAVKDPKDLWKGAPCFVHLMNGRIVVSARRRLTVDQIPEYGASPDVFMSLGIETIRTLAALDPTSVRDWDSTARWAVVGGVAGYAISSGDPLLGLLGAGLSGAFAGGNKERVAILLADDDAPGDQTALLSAAPREGEAFVRRVEDARLALGLPTFVLPEATPASPVSIHPSDGGGQARDTRATGAVAGNDPIDLLEDLARLHERGVLTDEEFAAKKADILKRL